MVNAVNAVNVESAAVAGVSAVAVAAANAVIVLIVPSAPSVPNAPSVRRVTLARARSGNALKQVMLRKPEKPKAVAHWPRKPWQVITSPKVLATRTLAAMVSAVSVVAGIEASVASAVNAAIANAPRASRM